MGAHLLGGQTGQRHALRQQPGGGQQRGAGAAGRAQHRDGGRAAVRAREGVREFEDAVHIRPAERVDRLVGVPEGDEGAAAAGQRVQESYLSGIGVLVLVDIDGVVPGGEPRGDLGPAGEEHRAVDEFGVVDHALEVEHVEVLGEEGGGGAPVGASRTAGEGVQRVRAETQFTGAGEDRADLVGETTRGQAGAQLVRPPHVREAQPLQVHLAGEQFPDRDVLLGAGEQPQRLHEQVAVLVGADQGVAERVEGGRLGSAGRAAPQGHAVAQFHRRLAAEGEHQDALGIVAPGDALGHGLDQRGGLAGARACENEQRAGGVVNHGALRGVQKRGVHRGRRGTYQSVSATAPPAHAGVRQAADGGRGAHVVRRSWWKCWLAGHRAWRAVTAG
ncbi:hypothetical protein GCM10010244_11930 [Streptomyces coeruleorubidus]|nr:hypothetical protein GCM10010244_11930 [Streptomyces bellus]